MVKKEVKKKVSSKRSSRPKSSRSKKSNEKLMIENFVSLQKVMTHLSGRFDNLSNKISELLKLFEDSARVIVKGEMEKKNEDQGNKQILDTMVSILDQNKVIAKGLTLMYETLNDSKPYSQKQSFSPIKKIIPQEKKKVVKEENSFPSKTNEIDSNPFMRGN